MENIENIKQLQVLEELEKLTKEIQMIIIEKTQNINMYNEKLKTLYNRLYNFHNDLKKMITPLTNQNE